MYKRQVLNRANDSATTLSDVQLSTQLTKDYQILVTSAPVMNQVIKELGLNMKASELASTISVDTPSDTRVLQITVTSDDPKRAKDIADKVAQVSSKKICDIMKIEQVNVIEEGSLSEEPAVDTVQKWTIIGLALSLIHIYAQYSNTNNANNTDTDSQSTYRYSYVAGNSTNNSQTADEHQKKQKKHNRFLDGHSATKTTWPKKFLSIVLSAAIFGVVAGSAMYGTYKLSLIHILILHIRMDLRLMRLDIFHSRLLCRKIFQQQSGRLYFQALLLQADSGLFIERRKKNLQGRRWKSLISVSYTHLGLDGTGS